MIQAGPIRWLFPRPRRPVRLRQALPLLVFMPVWAVVCLALELTDKLIFTAPVAFALAVFMPWLWWMHVAGMSGLRGVRGVLSLVVRLALAALLVMLLAEPRAVRRSEGLTVIYCADVSDSIGSESVDASISYITRTVQQKPTNDQAGLVVFAREGAVELPPGPVLPFEGAVNSSVSRDATDMSDGLRLAAALAPSDRDTRVVLISDGVSTQGDLQGTLSELKSRGVVVDVLPVDYSYEHEVWIDKLELPQHVKAGQPYEAGVIVASRTGGRGKLKLYENGRLIPGSEQEVDYGPGKTRFVLPFTLHRPGYYRYEARIESEDDAWEENNIGLGDVFLRGAGQVLVVVDPGDKPAEYRPLVEALERRELLVEVKTGLELPRESAALQPYDCVLLVNAPADALDAAQMEALRDGVYNLGIGLLMVGGPNSFGPGGYHRTVIEEALPVDMDIPQRKVLPKGALAIVLHTCEFAQGNTWAKRITREAMRVLSSQDEVGVLAFDYNSGDSWVFPLTPAGRYAELVPKVMSAQIGDMPSFAPTMQLALKALQDSDASAKHLIIISDGDPSPPPPNLLQAYVDSGITVSTVAVFPHGGTTTGVMRNIANVTKGRFYFPQDPTLLPSIFIKEAKTIRKNMIQTITFTPKESFPSPVLDGNRAMPPLYGYVLTSPKARAQVVLRGPDEEIVDPVLAIWRFGVGQSAAFTSDLNARWGKDWVGWDRYTAFVGQLVTEISRPDRIRTLDMRAYAAGATGQVLIDDTAGDERFLQFVARVQGPRGQTEDLEIRQVGPRRYEASFPLWGRGNYQVVARPVGAEGESESIVASFAVPYSAEYLRFRSNPIVLERIAEETGGRLLTGEEEGRDVFVPERAAHLTDRSVADLFLVVIACLVPLDVAVRRVQPDLKRIIDGLRGKRAAASAETMGALLRRKAEVRTEREAELDREREARAAAARQTPTERPPVRRADQPARPAATERPPQAPTRPEDTGSTAGRLLAMKRRRREQNQDDQDQGGEKS